VPAGSNFRRLAGHSLRELIYREIAYQPEPVIPLAWQQFHDRVTANHNSGLKGFGLVVHGLAALLVALCRRGPTLPARFWPSETRGQLGS